MLLLKSFILIDLSSFFLGGLNGSRNSSMDMPRQSECKISLSKQEQ